jgi:Carboxypeptidase regulatory-like domain
MRVLGIVVLACVFLAPGASAQNEGKISGVVVDAKGTPQMGATVMVASEPQLLPASFNLLTDGRGRFTLATLPPGPYTVKVTLAGFLPAMEQHIRVTDRRVTLMQVVLGSVFSSFEQLRQKPDEKVSSDDWTWVLRQSPDTRSVLRWTEGPVISDAQMSGTEETTQKHADHVQMHLTSGADHPGSIGSAADSPATTVVYDMSVGDTARLLMAGQFSYDGVAPAAGFAAEWLPSGEAGSGRVLVLEARQSQFGPMGPIFRGLRISDSDKVSIGDQVTIRYGAEFLAAGFGGTTQSLRPHGEVAFHLAPSWMASAIVAAAAPDEIGLQSGPESPLNTLDEFPTVMMHDGRPILENGWHEEFAVDHALTKNADVAAAVFHDRSTHTALIGRGSVNNSEFLQDYFSDVFAYDGGVSESNGVRLTYRQRFNNNLSTMLVYAFGGALAPNEDISDAVLRDELSTQNRQSVAGRVTTKIPWANTEVSASYKWINGPAVSQVDGYGESLYHIDPYLSTEIRQPLPKPFPGHVEVMAEVGNLLAQGYIPLSTNDGHVVLISSYRFFRGGVSLLF